MATIVTRSGKGSALSFTEMDANFTNLNTDKIENITAENLGDLANVDLTGIANGSVIQYNSTSENWEIGSSSGITDVVQDTTPQLGGNLDVNGNSIVSASAGNITITPDTTGSIVLDGQNWPQADGTEDQFLKTNGAGQLSYATVTQATGSELENVVEDTTPQLGGNLDLNENDVTGTGNVDITGNVIAQSAINAQTGTTYTTVLADASKLVTLSNASAITLTIPPNSSVAYPTGTKIDFAQIGAGQVTVAGGSGVTVNATPGLLFRAQYSAATCIKTGTDTWLLVGDLAASE